MCLVHHLNLVLIYRLHNHLLPDLPRDDRPYSDGDLYQLRLALLALGWAAWVNWFTLGGLSCSFDPFDRRLKLSQVFLLSLVRRVVGSLPWLHPILEVLFGGRVWGPVLLASEIVICILVPYRCCICVFVVALSIALLLVSIELLHRRELLLTIKCKNLTLTYSERSSIDLLFLPPSIGGAGNFFCLIVEFPPDFIIFITELKS
jgi:hypothetical protein